MLKLLQIILAIVAAVAVDYKYSSLQYVGDARHPNLSSHCYYSDHKLPVAINETIYPTNLEKSCIKVSCREDYVLEIRHCEHPDLDLCVVAEYDYTKPFPACCPLITCGDSSYRIVDNI